MKYLLKNTDGGVIAESASLPVYDQSRQAWAADGGLFADPAAEMVIEALPEASIKVSPVEFKLLFSAAERVAIKTARQTDPVIDDFYDIVEDPRLTHVDLGLPSTQDALAYLESKGLIATERRIQILAGKVQ